MVVRSIASRMVWVMMVVLSAWESVIYRSNVVVEGITRVMVLMYVEVMGVRQEFSEGWRASRRGDLALGPMVPTTTSSLADLPLPSLSSCQMIFGASLSIITRCKQVLARVD